LFLYNFNKTLSNFKELDLSSLPAHAFKMETCQRKLILSATRIDFTPLQPQIYHNHHAYEYLLEMICGLKSRLIAENEIVSQYKESLKGYFASDSRDSRLLPYLQKLLQDHKKIRTQHLHGISQRTYAAITKKTVLKKSQNIDSILIWGSGSLAEDLINQFKKNYNVYICARNHLRVQTLVSKHNIQSIAWNDFQEALDHSIHINTIGSEEEIFSLEFINSWLQNKTQLFVDLGSPSPVSLEACFQLHQSELLITLEDIFTSGAIANEEKEIKIIRAKQAIKSVSSKRFKQLTQKNVKKPAIAV